MRSKRPRLIPKPWHTKAIAMKAAGFLYEDIAFELEVSETTLVRFFNPGYRERQNKIATERINRLMRDDPHFRAKRKEYFRAYAARKRAEKTAQRLTT